MTIRELIDSGILSVAYTVVLRSTATGERKTYEGIEDIPDEYLDLKILKLRPTEDPMYKDMPAYRINVANEF